MAKLLTLHGQDINSTAYIYIYIYKLRGEGKGESEVPERGGGGRGRVERATICPFDVFSSVL